MSGECTAKGSKPIEVHEYPTLADTSLALRSGREPAQVVASQQARLNAALIDASVIQATHPRLADSGQVPRTRSADAGSIAESPAAEKRKRVDHPGLRHQSHGACDGEPSHGGETLDSR